MKTATEIRHGRKRTVVILGKRTKILKSSGEKIKGVMKMFMQEEQGEVSRRQRREQSREVVILQNPAFIPADAETGKHRWLDVPVDDADIQKTVVFASFEANEGFAILDGSNVKVTV